MTFREGLWRARSHIIFIAGLISAMALIVSVDADVLNREEPANPGVTEAEQLLATPDPLKLRAPRSLQPDELQWARLAWHYFENNVDPDTGLANAADRYPSTTMWDTASYVFALMAAERLGIIDRVEFDRRCALMLASLAHLPLYDGALPNKAYHTRTLLMVDYNNNPTTVGIGWSGLDIGRMAVALIAVARAYPEQSAAVWTVIERWNLGRLVRDGRLRGGAVEPDGSLKDTQEGRLGYEQYAARGVLLLGADALFAGYGLAHVAFASVEGVRIPYDERPQEKFDAPVFATSEPYFLTGLEFGFDGLMEAFGRQIYYAQKQRYLTTRTVTAVSEGHLDQPPFFGYSTVYGNGTPWAVLTSTGEALPGMRTFNTKAAFSWAALFDDDYAPVLQTAALPLNDPQRGWYEGQYEGGKVNAAMTANTNGIILESLHYRVFGPFLRQNGRGTSK